MIRNDASGVGVISTGSALKIEKNPRPQFWSYRGKSIRGDLLFADASTQFVCDQGGHLTIGGTSARAIQFPVSQSAVVTRDRSLELFKAKNNPPLQPIELSHDPATRSRWRWALPDDFFVSKKRQYVDQVMRSAIYVLFQGVEVVYVGQSSNVYSRLATHNKDKAKAFDSFRILYCKQERMSYWERKLIKAYEPRYNVSQNRRKAKALGYKTPNQRMKEILEG